MSESPAADFQACEALARAHYENFAIGSRLLPRRLRRPLAAIYACVRIADDLADDPTPGVAPDAALEEWQRGLDAAAAGGAAAHFAQRACGAVIRELALPLEPFHALFRAFRRDVVQRRYATFDELLGYCRDSANPVGRLVLLLFGARDAALHAPSDAICTGLQLVNHWQDVAADARRGRIYLPAEDMTRFGVDPEQVLHGADGPALRALLAFETSRARAWLERGAPLVAGTRGRLRVEVALFRRAGLAACDALSHTGFAVMAGPPRLAPGARARVLARGLWDAARAPRLPSAAGSLAPSEASRGA